LSLSLPNVLRSPRQHTAGESEAVRRLELARSKGNLPCDATAQVHHDVWCKYIQSRGLAGCNCDPEIVIHAPEGFMFMLTPEGDRLLPT
jgi:hypothetical protein